MDRAELERLDRSTLIAKAEAHGVMRANILTRPELIDELLVRTARQDDRELPKARGFFGRARDLVARVIEKGLHLPDAAERFRSVSTTATQIAARIVPTVVPTVTLAEIYAAQGHRPRALETLRRVLELEPEHAAARALLTKLETAPDLEATPSLPPEEDEEKEASPEEVPPPAQTADVPSPRQRHDIDECVAMRVGPDAYYVYWEARDRTLEELRDSRPGGTLTLRLVVITPLWDGPRPTLRDLPLDSARGNDVARELPSDAVVRVAVGWKEGETFLPIAHSPVIVAATDTAWPPPIRAFALHTSQGQSPVSPDHPSYPSLERALGELARIDSARVYGPTVL